jgi:hypothetical protein
MGRFPLSDSGDSFATTHKPMYSALGSEGGADSDGRTALRTIIGGSDRSGEELE